jgi:hypothetical protein
MLKTPILRGVSTVVELEDIKERHPHTALLLEGLCQELTAQCIPAGWRYHSFVYDLGIYHIDLLRDGYMQRYQRGQGLG